MTRDIDKAALHATMDLLLRSLAKPAPRRVLHASGSAPVQPQAQSVATGPQAVPNPGALHAPAPDALVAAYQGAKSALRTWGTDDPLDAIATVVGAGTVLFYLAEKGKNPKCETVWDALVFITTCLSVGYDDVFARTSAGKAIASFVMTVGPSIAARAFDPPRAEAEREAAETAATQRAIVERLDAILATLRAAPTPRTNAPPAS
jgi:hypothetical protein